MNELPTTPLTVADVKRQRRAVRAQRAEAVRERRAAAYRLRLEGCSFREVAAALGVSLKTAFEDVQRELAVLNRDASESLQARRTVMLHQLDRLKRGLHGKAADGDARAAEVVVKILDRESRLIGGDAPMRAIVATREVGAPGDAWRVLAAAAATAGLTDDERRVYAVALQKAARARAMGAADPAGALAEVCSIAELKILEKVARRKLLGDGGAVEAEVLPVPPAGDGGGDDDR